MTVFAITSSSQWEIGPEIHFRLLSIWWSLRPAWSLSSGGTQACYQLPVTWHGKHTREKNKRILICQIWHQWQWKVSGSRGLALDSKKTIGCAQSAVLYSTVPFLSELLALRLPCCLEGTGNSISESTSACSMLVCKDRQFIFCLRGTRWMIRSNK